MVQYNIYSVRLERYDKEFDIDQPMWAGEVVAETAEDAAFKVLAVYKETETYRYAIKGEPFFIREARDGEKPGMLSGDWAY